MFDARTINMKARVIGTIAFYGNTLTVGDEVVLTRDHRHIDGTVATDHLGSWGRIGEEYELIEEGDDE